MTNRELEDFDKLYRHVASDLEGLRSVVSQRLDEYPADEYPEAGTTLRLLERRIGEVALVARKAVGALEGTET